MARKGVREIFFGRIAHHLLDLLVQVRAMPKDKMAQFMRRGEALMSGRS